MAAEVNILIVLLALLILLTLFWLVFRHELTIRYLQKTEKRKQDELAIVSHQLRTPLTTIKWYTEMLLNQEFGKLQIAQLELLSKIDDSISRSVDILNTFLEKVRTRRFGAPSRPVTVDLIELVANVIDTHRSRIEQKNHSLHFEKPDERYQVYADPLVLHGILDAVFSNAIIYTDKPGDIRIRIENDRLHCIVSIEDSGIGIPLHEHALVFREFFRTKQARLIYPTGNGLSLHIVQQILEEMGGSIRFESREGHGTTFFISLPKSKH